MGRWTVLQATMLVLSMSALPSAVMAQVKPPSPPREFVDTNSPEWSGARLTRVRAGDDLQAALDAARCGDVLELEAGATFTGNFVLRKKSGTGWISITSSAIRELPAAGHRVTPQHADKMPKIVSPNDVPAIATEFGAHHYRLTGLEVTTTASATYNLILLGYQGLKTSQPARQLLDLPSHIIFDRLYIHGSEQLETRRGILIDGRYIGVVDSHISNIHQSGDDTQALATFNGAGPFKITNNYLEAAGENIMFGGMDPTIPNLVPADIEFRHNYCFKPLSWQVGHASHKGKEWTIKNSFELKNARRVLVSHNIFENNWSQAQDGTSILFTVRNQDGKAPWSTVEDVNFEGNLISGSDAGFLLLGMDTTTGVPSQQLQRIRIHNNLLLGIRRTFFSLITDTAPMLDLEISHNTGLHDGEGNSALFIEESNAPVVGENISITNNILSHGPYGIAGSGTAAGTATFEKFLRNYELSHNILYGNNRNDPRVYPPSNHHPADLPAIGLADPSRGDYRLSSSSRFRATAIDLTDPGIRAEELASILPRVRSGDSAD